MPPPGLSRYGAEGRHRKGTSWPAPLSPRTRSLSAATSEAGPATETDRRRSPRPCLASSPSALRAATVPAEVSLQITHHDVVRRGKRLVSARQEFHIACDGAELATAVVDFSCHSPAVYRRLRGEYSDLRLANARKLPLPEAVAPQLVARDRARDVVLSPTGRPDRWQLRVDTSHPVLFDHPVDHAPGMLMIEAARQAAQTATPGFALPVTMECSFERYAEMDAPSWVQARTTAHGDDGSRQVEVGIEQHGRPVLAARITSLPTRTDASLRTN
ncbi:ScbA/BarX family gamma-butyrolactone biosynthesis protein [Streptomyces sp. NPDC050636]|uniref:ScbA/BarX family gamma-butyrolactone biosynthesis protein n=1 Tax=Streptomyces sp. NPDC050636 TaxID=3154510 RepID=UPI003424DA8C